MCGVEAVGDLDSEGQNELCLHWPASDWMLQSQAVQKLHDDERLTCVLSDFMNGADVGMIQCRSGLRFALEAGERLRGFGPFIGGKLQRDEATEGYVFGLVDHTHATATELLDDAVVRDGLAEHAGEIE